MKKTICRKISHRIPDFDDTDFEGYESENGDYMGDCLIDKVKSVVSETEEKYRQEGFSLKNLDVIALLGDGLKDEEEDIKYPISNMSWFNIRSILNGYAYPGQISKVRIVFRFKK